MQLAHTLGESGPEIEFLIIAAAMLVLGVIFFLQKSVKPAVSVVLVLGAFAMGAGAFAVGGSDNEESVVAGSAAMSLEIVSPSDGDSVPAGEPVRLQLDLQGADLDQPDAGHFDVRIDEELETMTPETNPEITFEPGEHELSVEYVNSRHQSFAPPVTDNITITAE